MALLEFVCVCVCVVSAQCESDDVCAFFLTTWFNACMVLQMKRLATASVNVPFCRTTIYIEHNEHWHVLRIERTRPHGDALVVGMG